MERRFLVFDNLEAAILDSTGQRTNLHQPSSTMHAIQTADLKSVPRSTSASNMYWDMTVQYVNSKDREQWK